MRIRTGYSFGIAVGHLSDVVKRIEEIGWKVAPISDRMSTFGFTKFTKLVTKKGLRPIYGVEIAVVPALGEKRPTIDYWTFFAKDKLRPLHDLIEKATTNPGREPSLLYKQALGAKGLIKIASDRVRLAEISKGIPADFYFGLAPSTPKSLLKEVQKRKIPCIAVSDNYYTESGDTEFYRVTLGSKAFTQTYPLYILSDEEWLKCLSHTASSDQLQAALKNRDKAMKLCVAQQEKGTLLKPKTNRTLRELCLEGAKRLSVNLRDPVYKERLERELKLIDEKKFEDYFFIIADMINWAKERMIVGPARGSSCGSLVCYLINITTVDPIPYGLIFERFIDTTRADLPDIDIDFSDARRQMVFDYAEEKYGLDRVARLGTVGLFKPRSSLKQAGMSLQIPPWMVEKVLDGVVERSSGDSRYNQALEDTLTGTEMGRRMMTEFPEAKIAQRMEGHPNNASQHAAGIVITEKPIAEYVAVNSRTKAVMADKKDAEELNLLKIDALGLTQLSIFERTLELIGKEPKNGYLESLPLDDPKAFEVLNRQNYAGIFQFTGGALQSLAKSVDINSLEDMVSITALARPGPMETGGANSWVKRRMGREPVTTLHPMLTELTKETYGVVIYQETVMRVVREMGMMSWEETSAIRKAMSGRLGKEFFEGYWKKFLIGAVKNGVDEVTAKAIWDQINTFGSWAFNRSHAVAYGIVSYYCCYLKAHFPIEFAAATLDAETEPSKQIGLLRELKEEGVDYVPVDPVHSTDRWMPLKKGKKSILVGPLTAIKGFGSATVSEILQAREKGEELRATIKKRLAGAKTDIDTLFPIADRIAALHPDTSSFLRTKPTSVIDVQCGVKGEVVIMAVARRIAPVNENEPLKVMKRGGKVLMGPVDALNLFMRDDTDEIFCKINRYLYTSIGREVAERGKSGKALYVIKGTVPPDFRMIKVQRIKYLGDME